MSVIIAILAVLALLWIRALRYALTAMAVGAGLYFSGAYTSFNFPPELIFAFAASALLAGLAIDLWPKAKKDEKKG